MVVLVLGIWCKLKKYLSAQNFLSLDFRIAQVLSKEFSSFFCRNIYLLLGFQLMKIWFHISVFEIYACLQLFSYIFDFHDIDFASYLYYESERANPFRHDRNCQLLIFYLTGIFLTFLGLSLYILKSSCICMAKVICFFFKRRLDNWGEVLVGAAVIRSALLKNTWKINLKRRSLPGSFEKNVPLAAWSWLPFSILTANINPPDPLY